MLVCLLVCWSAGPHITLSAKKVAKVAKVTKVNKSRQNISPKFVAKICRQNLSPKFVAKICLTMLVRPLVCWSVRWSPYHFKCKKVAKVKKVTKVKKVAKVKKSRKNLSQKFVLGACKCLRRMQVPL
jgi:hypothetical protein